MVDAELPEPLVGGAARVSVLHPEVRCRGNDEKHQGSHAAEGAPSRQSVEHRGEAVERSVLLSIQQLVGTQNVIDPSLIIRTKLIRMPTESNLFVLLAFTESVFFFFFSQNPVLKVTIGNQISCISFVVLKIHK